jgi:Tfp pilus assembly protein PilO
MNAVALQRQLAYRFTQLGVTGTLGLAMLLLAGLAWFSLVRSGEAEVAGARSKLQALKQQAAIKSSLPLSSALNREEQLRVFYSSFARAEQVPETLNQIYQAAEKQNLTLETGEYTPLQAGSERLARLRVSLPVKGSFRQVLGFMDAVLQANNTVALENAAFKRDKVDDEMVEAKLVFLLFVDTQP